MIRCCSLTCHSDTLLIDLTQVLACVNSKKVGDRTQTQRYTYTHGKTASFATDINTKQVQCKTRNNQNIEILSLFLRPSKRLSMERKVARYLRELLKLYVGLCQFARDMPTNSEIHGSTKVSTIRYGDVGPVNHAERQDTMLVTLLGVIIFAFAMGNINKMRSVSRTSAVY